MSDYRVKYLKFTESRPLLISGVATSILCTMSVIGLLLEHNKRCQPDMQLWLIVVIVRSAVRLACRLFVAYTTLREENIVDQIHTGSKFVDILDVFGIVWFAVGNLLVFNNFACISESPIVFFSGLSYICGSYINFFLPSVLRLTFTCYSLSHTDDIAYLRQTADADREIAMVHLRTTINGSGLGAASSSSAYSSELTPERAQYWVSWLESYGCHAVSYHPSMKLNEEGNTNVATPNAVVDSTGMGNGTKNSAKYAVLNQAEAEPDIELGLSKTNYNSNTQIDVYASVGNNAASNDSNMGAGNIDTDFCSICLNPFESRSEVSHAGDPAAPTNGVAAVADRTARINETPSPNVAEENYNIIVRYPCQGKHYFHAHCLHSWLQVSSARYLNQARRPGVLPASPELQQEAAARQVTCPCCREQPPPPLLLLLPSPQAQQPSTTTLSSTLTTTISTTIIGASPPSIANPPSPSAVPRMHTVELTRRPGTY